ncbi:hypothetical protein [Romboutsia sp.]|uniref:hypothetical protein n=1 Tax=Romboutsia sp. TaxID=1965302 RepID=UPI003F2A2C2B
MSKKNIISGRNANQNGKYVQDCVHDFLDKVCGYEYVPPNKFLVTSNSLSQKLFTRQLAICDSIDSLKADFVLYNPKYGKHVLDLDYPVFDFFTELIGEK